MRKFSPSAFVFMLCLSMQGVCGGESKELPEVESGRAVFVKAGCQICHANGGNSLNSDKPLKGTKFLKSFKDDRALARFIRQGREERGMPSFAKEKLSDRELSQVIVYIRSLTSSTSAR